MRRDALGASLLLLPDPTDFLDGHSPGICVSEKDGARRAKARDILLVVSPLDALALQAAKARARSEAETRRVQTARS